MASPFIPGRKYDVTFWREEDSATLHELEFEDELSGFLIFRESSGDVTVSDSGVGDGVRRRFINRSWVQELVEHPAEVRAID